ncbi:MAG: hypothetical protein KDD01_22550 [Phaeodactylibacter sp.]|nr:hypothetical protein [Phaeodactylibacter sp.]MCB0616872.1 hypothetical protein [Phaeodactylibacter sp.]
MREICSNNGCSPAGYAYFPSAHGGFYLGGSIGPDALILKFDENDSLLWQKRFSISPQSELVTQLVEYGGRLAGIVTVDAIWSYCFGITRIRKAWNG